MDAKLQIMSLETRAQIYTPEAQAALNKYKEHLVDTRVRLGERERVARIRLGEYEGGGEAVREVARRYAGVLKKMETVRGDIRRLGGKFER